MTKDEIQLEAYKQICYAAELDLDNDELSGFVHGVIALEMALSESMQDTNEQPDEPQINIDLLEKLGREQNHIDIAPPLK